jgi:hypothetical protein
MMFFPWEGEAYLYLQYGGSGLNTATAIDTNVLCPQNKKFVYFQQGQNAGLANGVILTGQTSGCVIRVDKVLITEGTTSGSDALGVLFFDHLNAYTVVSGENLRVSTTTYAVAASNCIDAPYRMNARSLFVQTETNSIRFIYAGNTPTTSGGTPANLGAILTAGNNIVIAGWEAVRRFKFINAVNGGLATVNIHVSY